jgi:hypothetical protein
MTPSLLSSSPAQRHSASRDPGAFARRRPGARRERAADRDRRLLGRYVDAEGRTREVIAQAGAAGSVLVIDRDRTTNGDRHLLAHLAVDEPTANADVVCSDYMKQAVVDRCRCRLLTVEDARTVPFADVPDTDPDARLRPGEAQPVDDLGRCYRIAPVAGRSIPELRWCRTQPQGTAEHDLECGALSVRDAVAALESYEPVRALTRDTLASHAGSRDVSTTVLRAELARVQESPIVLNRRLREVALERIARQGLSMSEIAIRCGRVKRDHRGNESGETSWLARRLGLLPEGGRSAPTPWIHSDVLALIARSGLGLSPREVEL